MERYGSRTHQPENALVSRWGAPSLIKSVQAGTLATAGGTTNTATITAVVPENCVLYMTMTSPAGTASDARSSFCRLDLTNATTLTITINANAGFNPTIGYQVVEYIPGVLRSVQRGTISVATGNASNTGTITAVDTAKAFVNYLGMTTDTLAMWDANGTDFRLALTNATTVTATRNTAVAATDVVGYQVVEFY